MSGELRRSTRTEVGLPEYRQMPVNIEMEQAVLGTLLLYNHTWAKVADILTPDCFFDRFHKQIFEVVSGLLEQGQPANAITCRTYLGEQDLGGGLTPAQYLARLSAESSGPNTEIRRYCMFLNDLRARREAISVAKDLLEQAYEAPVGVTAKTVVDTAVSVLGRIRTTIAEEEDFQDFSTVSHAAINTLFTDWKDGGKAKGISTGYQCLDDAMGGLEQPDFILIAGRPGSGKTALATNIAFNVAKTFQAHKEAGYPLRHVGFFSLEMSGDQLWQRVISDASGIPSWRIKRRALSDSEMERLVSLEKDLNKLPIHIDASGKLSISQIELRARALHKQGRLHLLVIDYVQLIGGRAKKGGREDNRVQELTDITTSLKALAKELEIPIVALAQVSREVDKRDNKRPLLGDLRESGSLEQDADMVLLLYREEYYLKDAKPQEGTDAYLQWERRMAQVKGVAEVNIAKQRHGPPCIVTMGFHAELTRFLNEPEPRDETMEPIREKAKGPLRMPADSPRILHELKAMEVHQSVPNKELEGVPRWVKKVIDYMEWKERCVLKFCDPDQTDAAKAKFMRDAMVPLMDNGFIEGWHQG